MDNKPNLFLIGAPKCGSTSLYQYLRAHPEIYMSPSKEPGFFLSSWKSCRNNMESYLDLFIGRTKRHLYAGEATTLYLRSRRAIDNLYKFDSNANIIVLVRNPLELAPAFHSEMLNVQCEDVQRFERAWEIREKRLLGEMLPDYIHYGRHKHLLDYGNIALLGEQLEYLYSVFPVNQVKVLVYDDFKRDAGAATRSVLRWLGVDENVDIEYATHRKNVNIRSHFLARFLHQPPDWIRVIVSRLKKMIRFNGELFVWVRTLNQIQQERPQIPQNTKNQMKVFLQKTLLYWGLLSTETFHIG